MVWSFPIGVYFGAQLRIHATFILLLLWVMVSAYLNDGIVASFVDGSFIFLLLASVLAHEAGHRLAERQFGLTIQSVTLLPIGGMLDKGASQALSPVQDVLVALAGPAMSLLVWFALTTIEDLMPLSSEMLEDEESWLHLLALVNLYLALFNLVPAFPMDGGRVLRSVLSFVIDRDKADRIALICSQIVIFALGLWGLVQGSAELLLLSIFIFLASVQHYPVFESRARERKPLPDELIETNFTVLSIDDPVERLIEIAEINQQNDFPVFDEGRFVGFVTRNALAIQINRPSAGTSIRSLLTTNVPVLQHTSKVDDVHRTFVAQGVNVAAVTTSNGKFVGFITRDRLLEYDKKNST